MPRLPRMALVLLLAAILATTAALADPLWGVQSRRSTISSSDPMDFFAKFWGFLTHVWTKNGSQVDPDGVQTKNGSQVDPSGMQMKNGSMIEPDGSKLQTPPPATPNRDNGSDADPNG
jgi:hypothetical protein